MSNDCPKCGAKAIGTDAWSCGSWKAVFDETHKQSISCKMREQAQTIERLEAAGDKLYDSLICMLMEHPAMCYKRAKDDPIAKAWKEAKGE